ncbi:unnamed protein product, partial [marine sediment metagenome]
GSGSSSYGIRTVAVTTDTPANYGLRVQAGGSGITDNYGVYIDNTSGGDYNYPIYQAGTTGTNVFNADTLLDGGAMLTSPYGGFGRFVNHLAYSEMFNQASWTKSGVTVSADATAAPDGPTSADRIDDDGAVGGGYVSQNETMADAGEEWVFSVWIKDNNTSGDISIEIDDNGSGSSTTLDIDPPTEWKRYWLTHTGTTGATQMTVIINHTTSLSDQFYVWGAQFEDFSTPGVYISTYNTAFTNTHYGLSLEGSDNIVLGKYARTDNAT